MSYFDYRCPNCQHKYVTTVGVSECPKCNQENNVGKDSIPGKGFSLFGPEFSEADIDKESEVTAENPEQVGFFMFIVNFLFVCVWNIVVLAIGIIVQIAVIALIIGLGISVVGWIPLGLMVFGDRRCASFCFYTSG